MGKNYLFRQLNGRKMESISKKHCIECNMHTPNAAIVRIKQIGQVDPYRVRSKCSLEKVLDTLKK
ncbi:hypothetical protein DN53_01100 [Flagellimonas olearia]|uniref:Uncharacterized protein n=1 Tax=Flagellimonas olearia TaxID=552546 RepID=A0A444VPV5_9FLAO|nr:hypothetical protein DN53_01100 [Allomuricauda olearia]